jgi:RhtB (resistance to homoserine/threonine) family protein
MAAISPGPDFILTIRNSMLYSRRTGIYTGMGIALGLCIHLFYCAAGVGYLISRSVMLFSIIKFLGAGYLIYIGVSSILSRGSFNSTVEEKSTTELSRTDALKMGFLTNVLNPKATLFFLSLFTFVINPKTPLYIVLIISLIIVVTALTWFTIVSVFFTQKRVQENFLKYGNIINRLFGGLLIAIGIKIVLTFK